MKVVEEILKWASTLDDWQSDAVRRIWIKNELDETDEEELYIFLKEHLKLILKDKDTKTKPTKFSKSDIGSATVHGQRVILNSLHELENVNAIPETEQLEFGEQGLTVVYGDNSAGKSGYSRVLKKSCSARGTADRIYSNIYNKQTSAKPAQAKFIVKIDDESPTTIQWVDGQSAPECLGNIAVFDAKTARVYVDDANTVNYIPYGLDIFTKLASLYRIFRTRIQAEIIALPEMSDSVAELIGSSLPIKKITTKTTAEDIDKLVPFSKEDEKRFIELNKTIVSYKANDPTKKAQELRRQKGRVDGLRKQLLDVASLLSSKATLLVKNTSTDAIGANEAAKLASEKAFTGEPMKGTGSTVWRLMFDSAKKFSEQQAYKDKPFPVTDDDSLCLLCQQPLGEQAKDRMQRFWSFVEADTSKVAKEKTRIVNDMAEMIKQMEIDLLAKTPQLQEELSALSLDTANSLKLWITKQKERRDQILEALRTNEWDKVPAFEPYPSSRLSALSRKCESDAKKAEKLADAESQKKAENLSADLSYRKTAQENKKSMLLWVDRLQKEEKLLKALKAVDTTQITRKGSGLMEQALTKELENKLNDEFDALGIEHLKMKFQRSGSMGNTLHQLQLQNLQQGRMNLSEILSEGEHRVVAIASFFAELSTSNHNCGIVFDDPVSSLDHHWRTRVASRLVAEAKERQVIVFTHDIVFLLELEQQAKEQKVDLLAQTVYRSDKIAGLNTKDVPWDAKPTKSRIGILKQIYQKLEKLHRDKKFDEYNFLIHEFYGRLRQTWERAIEEVLLKQSVMRFRQGIETKRLNEVVIEPQDIEDIEKGMTKASKWMTGHDKAAAVGSTSLLPKEVKEDLDLIDKFRVRVEKRRQK